MSFEKIKPELILIDLDGTLIDSVPDLAYCVDEMMKQLDMPVRGIDAVRNWVGNGVQRLTERALVNAVEGMPDQDLMDRAYPIFLELYKHNNSQRSAVYDGVFEGIAWMKENGYRVACVTNKAEAFTIPLLKNKKLHDLMEIIVSGDTCAEKKPHPMPLLHAADKLGANPKNCLMLGDSRSDVKAARAAEFNIFCMTYGYNHGEDIRDYNPDVVMDSFMELPNYLVAK
ncbi:MAG: phosphoglycolate phosphatase [Gammaproteobacteria bacterium]|nr:phosphoglycolate phosphatase [Gammaproteobacteria bacterium]